MMKKLKDIGELKLIEKFMARYKVARHTIVGIGDDSAVVRMPGTKELLLFTCDTLVEGIHFPTRKISGYKIGWKALGTGLSDIAAMGGIPVSALVSLAVPAKVEEGFVNGLIRGINSLARRFNVDIVGGDTVSSPKAIVITIAVVGTVSRKKLVLRSGAKAGDKIFVTGALGGSIFKKQFNFTPRIVEAQRLVSHAKINSMIDITDGLSMDLYRLITASQVGAILYKEAIPISRDAYKTKDPLRSALCDGEDFELLITSKDERIPFNIIGEITRDRGRLVLIDKNGRIERLKLQGYEHFK